jgi:hypothetical protein
MCERAGSGLGMHEGINHLMDGLWTVLLRGMDRGIDDSLEERSIYLVCWRGLQIVTKGCEENWEM